MRINPNISDEEYHKINSELHSKLDKGETLTKDEEFFICNCLEPKYLLQYPFCIDEFFKRTFLARNIKLPTELYPLTERDHIYYNNLVKEWHSTINKLNHSDQLIYINAKETRDELKNLNKQYFRIVFKHGFQEYQKRKLELIEWSRYRYGIIKNIFELLIKSNQYKLTLNGNDIIFNYYSLTHILTRHFGFLVKRYDTSKSHFVKDFHFEQIHIMLETIFNKIDASRIYIDNSIDEINIRYNGTLYKIFIDSEINGSLSYLRLNSFFPIENPRMLDRLVNEFQESVIDNNLSVFTKSATNMVFKKCRHKE